MISKKARISQALFKEILRNKAFFVQNDLFSLRISPINENLYRVACTVSKKEAKTAVVRNSLRRRGYRTIREFEKDIHPGLAIIISLKKASLHVPYSEFKDEIKSSLVKARALS